MNEAGVGRTKRFVDPAEVDRREARLHEPHVASLTKLVERMRADRGGGNSVPWFDPDSGGVDAEVLLLFEAPGARAVGPGPIRPTRPGSGFISPDNNDNSAANVLLLEADARLERRRLLHWNIVPWYVGDGARIRAVRDQDLDEARSWLGELLALLPHLRVLVVCGKKAQKGWGRYDGERPSYLTVLSCPHPSPLNLNSRPAARTVILQTFNDVRLALDQPGRAQATYKAARRVTDPGERGNGCSAWKACTDT